MDELQGRAELSGAVSRERGSLSRRRSLPRGMKPLLNPRPGRGAWGNKYSNPPHTHTQTHSGFQVSPLTQPGDQFVDVPSPEHKKSQRKVEGESGAGGDGLTHSSKYQRLSEGTVL